MATTLDDSLKSLKQIKQEIKDLNQEMSNAGSAGDTKRFAELKQKIGEAKNDYRDLQQEMQYADPGEMLAGMTKVAQGAVGAFGAVTGTLDLIGVKNENIQAIQQKSMAIIQVLTSLESARQLLEGKGMLAGLAGQIKKIFNNTTIIAQEEAMIQKTKLQIVWTKALAVAKAALSNPIMAAVAGVAALGAGIYAAFKYSESFSASFEASKETIEKAQESVAKMNQEMAIYRDRANETNMSEETKGNLIDELNKKYGELNGQVLSQSATQKDINEYLNKANDNLREGIQLQAMKDEQLETEKKLLELEDEQKSIANDTWRWTDLIANREVQRLNTKREQISNDEKAKKLAEEVARIEKEKADAAAEAAKKKKEEDDKQKAIDDANKKAEDDKKKAAADWLKEREKALSFSEKYEESVMSEYQLLKKTFEKEIKLNQEYLDKKLISYEQYVTNVENINKTFVDKAKKLDENASDNIVQIKGKEGKQLIDLTLRTGEKTSFITKKLSEQEIKDIEEAEDNKIKAKEGMYALAQETSFQLANDLFQGYMDQKQTQEEAILNRESEILSQQTDMKMKQYEDDTNMLKDARDKNLITEEQYRNGLNEIDQKKQKVEDDKRKRELEIERKKFEIQKKAAKSEVMIKVANEVAKALISAAVHAAGAATAPLVPLDLAMAGAATAAGVVQTGIINKQKPGFKFGGIVGGEFGTDNTMIMASRGEFVVNPSATANNIDLLKAINNSNNTDIMQQILQAINNQKVTVSDRDIKTVGKKVSTIEARSSF